jgi:hypothetical protein
MAFLSEAYGTNIFCEHNGEFSMLKQVVCIEPLDFKQLILFKTMLHRAFVTAEQMTFKVFVPLGNR